MASKKRTPPRRDAPSKRAPSSTEQGRFELLLEEMRTQNRATIEAVEAQGAYLGARIDALRDSLTPRIEALEVAVRQHSEAIHRLAERIERLEVRMDRVEQRLDRVEQRLDRVEQRLDGVEQRLDGVEQRLDRADERQDGFEAELREVKAALGRVEAKLDTRADAAAVRDLERRVSILERRTAPPALEA